MSIYIILLLIFNVEYYETTDSYTKKDMIAFGLYTRGGPYIRFTR